MGIDFSRFDAQVSHSFCYNELVQRYKNNHKKKKKLGIAYEKNELNIHNSTSKNVEASLEIIPNGNFCNIKAIIGVSNRSVAYVGETATN